MSVHEKILCSSSLKDALISEQSKCDTLVVSFSEMFVAQLLTESKMMDGKHNPLSNCGLIVVSDPNLPVGTWVLGRSKKKIMKKQDAWVCAYCRSILEGDVWVCPNCLAVRQEVLAEG